MRSGLAFICALATLPLQAEPPKLEALFPAGGQAGSSFTLTASGKLDESVQLWTDAPGLYLTPTGKKREWQATLTAQASPGLYLVYAHNKEGVSDPRWFSIGRVPETAEVEPNDEVGKGQAVSKLPACLNGRLDKGGDVDGYTVTLKAGQTLVAQVEAYALGSPVDVMAHVTDPKGIRVLTASDARNLDPVIVYKAVQDGPHTIQVAGFAHPPAADVRFTGGATAVYRLHISAGPAVTQIYPAVITATGKTEMELRGPLAVAAADKAPAPVRLSLETAKLPRQGNFALASPDNSLRPIQLLVADKAAALEKEPNDAAPQATPAAAGAPVAGIIGSKGDVDRFSLAMKKGEKMQARVYATQLGLPLDATLRIEGPDGQVLATAADQGEQPDPNTAWTAAADGTYQIVIEDQFHQGGPGHQYVVEVGPAKPTLAVTLPERKPLALAAGKTLSVKVGIKPLNGFKGPFVARVAGLPAGVHAADVPVPEKGGDVEIKLQAAANAQASTSPLQVQVWTLPAEAATAFTADYPLRGEDARGTSLLDRASWLWLQVK